MRCCEPFLSGQVLFTHDAGSGWLGGRLQPGSSGFDSHMRLCLLWLFKPVWVRVAEERNDACAVFNS